MGRLIGTASGEVSITVDLVLQMRQSRQSDPASGPESPSSSRDLNPGYSFHAVQTLMWVNTCLPG